MNEKFKRLRAALDRASKNLHFATKNCKHNVVKVKWYSMDYAQCTECDSFIGPWDIYLSSRKRKATARKRTKPSEIARKLKGK